uniref:Uncharacterized protein n=2 Tax=Archaea TaxID=2157 RepID=D6PBY2_9ARCH|nr:hypothetical protein [uncultured archaeon MedDCM-OCT-S08-C54]
MCGSCVERIKKNPDLFIFSVYDISLKEKNVIEEKMSDFKENVEKLNVRGIVLSSVMTAFGLVVALVWKDTIIATVEYILPNTDDGTLQGMYISAIAVTVLVMVLAKFAINLNHRVEKEIERVQSYFDDDDDENEN